VRHGQKSYSARRQFWSKFWSKRRKRRNQDTSESQDFLIYFDSDDSADCHGTYDID